MIKLKTLSHKLPVKELAKAGAANKIAPQQLARRQLQGRTRDTKRRQVWIDQGGKCAVCDRVVFGKGEVHLDHIIPISHGGTDDDNNLQILCVPCHEDKTRKENSANGSEWSGKFF